jgi:hypothetical protein
VPDRRPLVLLGATVGRGHTLTVFGHVILTDQKRGSDESGLITRKLAAGRRAVAEYASVAEQGADIAGETGRIVETERGALHDEAVQQGHHDPGPAVGVQPGRDSAGRLAAAQGLDTLLRYHHQQGLSRRLLTAGDIVVPGLLST